ncbi:uncharacterized protein TNCV_724771 [Trichonephila clavipes]|nr:uncharacterized protein TNCV_724771 [Trichonephila clavipes]
MHGLFRCNVHLEIATEKKHQPIRAFYDGINNLRKRVACVKRKTVTIIASRKKQWKSCSEKGLSWCRVEFGFDLSNSHIRKLIHVQSWLSLEEHNSYKLFSFARSGRKGNTTGNVNPGRNKNRNFSGNFFTTQNDTEFTSASARKLKYNMNMEVPIAPSFAYCILEFVSVFAAISETVICETSGETARTGPDMGCPVGREAHTYVQKRDETHISRSERRTSDAVKQERIDIRAKQSALKEFQEEEEGVLYGLGIAD